MTQGLVSVVENGKVVFKIVAGCNGYNAPALAKRLSENQPFNIQKCLSYSREEDFGCEDCLVVMSDKEIISRAGEIGPLYRETFCNPTFNPRWTHGTAGYTCVVSPEGCKDG